MNRKQRMKNRATAAELYYKLPPRITCSNCGEKTHHGHFVPPSLGEKGFWACGSLYAPRPGDVSKGPSESIRAQVAEARAEVETWPESVKLHTRLPGAFPDSLIVSGPNPGKETKT